MTPIQFIKNYKKILWCCFVRRTSKADHNNNMFNYYMDPDLWFDGPWTDKVCVKRTHVYYHTGVCSICCSFQDFGLVRREPNAVAVSPHRVEKTIDPPIAIRAPSDQRELAAETKTAPDRLHETHSLIRVHMVIACRRCGCWMHERQKGLLQPCGAAPTARRRQDLHRLLNGQYPQHTTARWPDGTPGDIRFPVRRIHSPGCFSFNRSLHRWVYKTIYKTNQYNKKKRVCKITSAREHKINRLLRSDHQGTGGCRCLQAASRENDRSTLLANQRPTRSTGAAQ